MLRDGLLRHSLTATDLFVFRWGGGCIQGRINFFFIYNFDISENVRLGQCFKMECRLSVHYFNDIR